MSAKRSFDEYLAEAQAASTEGWDFSFLDGRATEERPPWGYARRMAGRVSGVSSVLDIFTGGGEVFAEALSTSSPRPLVVVATEPWAPNVPIAQDHLVPLGGSVVRNGEDATLPFSQASFDLVVSRHPTTVQFNEVARVLKPGGTYFAQHVGAGSNHELTDFLMGPQPISGARSPQRARSQAEAAGLDVVDLQTATLQVTFGDIGAVVYFLRKVIWTVPNFTVERYRDRLAALHEEIARRGPFMAQAERFLIEARKS